MSRFVTASTFEQGIYHSLQDVNQIYIVLEHHLSGEIYSYNVYLNSALPWIIMSPRLARRLQYE